MRKNQTFIVVLLILTGVFITACASTPKTGNTAQPVASSNGQVQPNNADVSTGVYNRTGMYSGNISDAQRQAMFQQRQQAAIDACNGKNVGDSCILESPRNNITGTCSTLNETIQCMINRTMNRTRGYNPTQ